MAGSARIAPSRRPRRRSCCASRPPRRPVAVSPSGRPQIARTWFSNWLVTAPSIVQWPELWTRGAISLNTGPSRGGEELERQHADIVERLGDLARPARAPRRPAPATAAAAGTVERARMPPSWTFSALSQKRTSPSAPRHRITENSAVERAPSLRRPARRCGRSQRLGVARRRRCATGPCRRSRRARVLRMPGVPIALDRARRARRPNRPRRRARAGRRAPRRSASRVSRSCAVSSARGCRAASRSAGARRAARPGTFSNS